MSTGGPGVPGSGYVNPYRDGFSSTEYEPVAERFLGFRAFEIVDQGYDHLRGTLAGIFKRNYHWSPGVNAARCLYPGRQPTDIVGGREHGLLTPVPECDCGFWAYANGDHIVCVHGPAVLGIIEGWGRMVIGPHGFRSQYARIVALSFPRQGMESRPPKKGPAPATVDDQRSRVHDLARGLLTALTSRGKVPVPVVSLDDAHTRPWENVPDELRRRVLERYRDVPVFDDPATMQAEFPLSNLSALLGDGA